MTLVKKFQCYCCSASSWVEENDVEVTCVKCGTTSMSPLGFDGFFAVPTYSERLENNVWTIYAPR